MDIDRSKHMKQYFTDMNAGCQVEPQNNVKRCLCSIQLFPE